MTLKEKINEDLKVAMKAKDEKSLRGIRAIKAAIILAETAEGRSSKDLTTEEEIAVLQKLIKQRKESLDIYIQNGKQDLAKIEQEEIEVIERYLPQPLSQEELETLIKETIQEQNAITIKDMGKVMKALAPKIMGRADNKWVAELIKKLLT
ncbi:MAG: aspartyl-tRNA amidotransferase subunit B [Bacteroidia bacterium]|nr:MAG: aspartyl-tRNA amidotransferase subunit B [Bacteroidia bacterium]